jgi:pimeloyl-ACP methyl ester carboxylesterase
MDVVFMPGIIAPASIRYTALVEQLGEVNPLLKDLEVYASDAPPRNYTVASEVAGLDAAADAAGFDRFHLYGYSAGGAIALAYVAAHPERVISVAIDEPASDFTAEARAELQPIKQLASLPDRARMRAFMQLQVRPTVQLPSPADGPQPEWMAARPVGVNTFVAAMDAHDLVADQYVAYRGPVLYTWGSLSNPRWDAMRDRLASRFRYFTSQRFEGLHHLNTSHEAHPDRVAQLLRELWSNT